MFSDVAEMNTVTEQM